MAYKGSLNPKIVFVVEVNAIVKPELSDKADKLLLATIESIGIPVWAYGAIESTASLQEVERVENMCKPDAVVYLHGKDPEVTGGLIRLPSPLHIVVEGDHQAHLTLILELYKLWKRINAGTEVLDYKLLDTIDGIRQYVDEVIAEYNQGLCKFVAFDYEFLGENSDISGVDDPFNPWKRAMTLSCIGLSHKSKYGRCIPLDHVDSVFRNDKVAQKAIIAELRRLFTTVPVGNQNLKLEIKVTHAKLGIAYTEFKEFFFDPAFASHCLYMGWKRHNLEEQSLEYLKMGHKGVMNAILDVLPKGKNNHLHVPLEILVDYNCGDVDAVQRLYPIHMKKLESDRMMGTYEKYYTSKFYPVIEMDCTGLPIDLTVWETIHADSAKKLEEIQNKLLSFEYVKKTNDAYGSFTPNGADWKVELLYNQMKLPVFFETEKKAPSTDADSRQKLTNYLVSKGNVDNVKVAQPKTLYKTDDFEGCLDVVSCLSDYQKHAKLHNSYVAKLPKFLGDDGYIHPTQNMIGTVTGRQSSDSPSFQTLPKKSDIKNIFMSRWSYYGGLILQGDESQAELRVMASQSKDPGLIDAFAKGLDIHRFIASRVFKVAYDKVTVDQRKFSKTTTFAILYGAGVETISADLKLDLRETQELVNEFYRMFPGVKIYVEEKQSFTRRNKYCLTPSGRRRYIFDIDSFDNKARSSAERQAFNTPIQGAASDIVLEALDMVPYMRKMGMKSKIFGFVHDALCMDSYPGELIRNIKIMDHFMTHRPSKINDWCSVALRTDFSIGVSWGQQVDIKSWNLLDGILELSGQPVDFDLIAKEFEYNTVEGLEILSREDGIDENGISFTNAKVKLLARKPEEVAVYA